MNKIMNKTLDELHRVVIPLDLRKSANIETNSTVYMQLVKDKIMISKNIILDKTNPIFETKINELGMIQIPAKLVKDLKFKSNSKINMLLNGSFLVLYNGN